MKKVNILILDGDMSRGGGTERITQILSSLLSSNSRFNIYVASLNSCTNTYYKLNDKVTFLSLSSGRIPILSSISQLYKIQRKYSIDIIINVDTFLSIYTIPLKILSRDLKVVSWEMFNIENDLGIKWSRQLRQCALWWSDYYVCLTQKDLAAFKREFSIKKPITYIYNPIDQELLSFNYNIESKRIVTAGHFYQTKGYDLAVEVAKLILPKHKDWKWYFYGDGVELDNIRKVIKEYKLEDQVVLAGRTQNISEIYEDTAIYVMTSRLEGFGLVLLEAKCHNVPVIAFDCPSGPAEIIEDNISGYLVSPFNIHEMAEKIDNLVTSPSKRFAFAQCSQNNLYKFSKEIFLSKWLDLINGLGDENSPREHM